VPATDQGSPGSRSGTYHWSIRSHMTRVHRSGVPNGTGQNGMQSWKVLGLRWATVSFPDLGLGQQLAWHECGDQTMQMRCFQHQP
jgi:hypothetical protein